LQTAGVQLSDADVEDIRCMDAHEQVSSSGESAASVRLEGKWERRCGDKGGMWEGRCEGRTDGDKKG